MSLVMPLYLPRLDVHKSELYLVNNADQQSTVVLDSQKTPPIGVVGSLNWHTFSCILPLAQMIARSTLDS